ncbi:hypothetical protein A374_08469 [Fictibacillus macauensis ZFHKF-1]|uniref:DUF3267 domain-containing protein n=1 Tax=Fictibacillus macauensis ZFHKF-1 TaxID=1196324 RepID=I8UG29_9BACL|nr:DUF3267 domain-containing protein [Fictibacillus macauensis]EIT85855.1 hypothetical protein A374_08469 [Fictibacillus macauensis ZFHKF-1]
MNCWKSVNLYRQYGTQRIYITACAVALFSFMVFTNLYERLFPSIYHYEYGLLPLLFTLITVLPIHKVLHCLPLWLTGKKAKIILLKKNKTPYLYCQFSQTVSRAMMIVSVMTPLFMVIALSHISAFAFPHLTIFFITFSAIHTGICSLDVLYLGHLLKAPKSSYVEDVPSGFHILVKQS